MVRSDYDLFGCCTMFFNCRVEVCLSYVTYIRILVSGEGFAISSNGSCRDPFDFSFPTDDEVLASMISLVFMAEETDIARIIMLSANVGN
jgi:hypothetical protein